MNRGLLLAASVVIVAVLWRCVWLSAGLTDTTWQADRVRGTVLPAVSKEVPSAHSAQWIVTFDDSIIRDRPLQGRIVQASAWNPNYPVWVVAGRDGQPGWAEWDDNGDGEVDELQELGAAWSDDHCLIAKTLSDNQIGRVIDHGAFIDTKASDFDLDESMGPFQFTVKISNE